MTPGRAAPDLARTTFAVLAMALLIIASLWIVRPFLGPAIWATMVVVATWPLMLRTQALLRGKRALAVVVMTVLLLLLFVVPLTVAIATIVGNTDHIVEWARLVTGYRLTPTAPAWLAGPPCSTPWISTPRSS